MTDEAINWGEGVRITAPALASLHFEWTGDQERVQALDELPVEYTLRLSRIASLSLAVEFGVHIVEIEGLTASAAFRMVASLVPDSPEAQKPEIAFRQFAARVAPLAIYPFVREALTSAAVKAALPAMVLPITNVGALFAQEELQLPDPPDSAEQGQSSEE